MTHRPFHKYPDIFLDIQTFRRYLENLGIFRNIYSVFGLALCFPPYVLKTIFSSFPETIQFSDLTVLHITKNAAKPEQFSNLVMLLISSTSQYYCEKSETEYFSPSN